MELAFLKLVRWKNLLFIALTQVFVKIYFVHYFENTTLQANLLFYALICATIFSASAGYIINDIKDVISDSINKPTKKYIDKTISKQKGTFLYWVLITLSVLIGTYISFQISKPFLSFIFFGINLLLYLYATYLKGSLLIGNVIVAALLSFCLLIVPIFSIPKTLTSLEWDLYINIKLVIYLYAIFAFLLNLSREIIKDIEDINGDYVQNLRTLPILFGRKTARNTALFFSMVAWFIIVLILLKSEIKNTLAILYLLFTILLPLLYYNYKLWNATSKKDFTFLSKLLKLIIFFGILSIPILSKIIFYVIG